MYLIPHFLRFFIFLLPLGFIKFGGISATFFVFLCIVIIYLYNSKKIFRLNNKIELCIIAFFLTLILSVIFAENTFRSVSIFSDVKTILQYIYWLLMTLFLVYKINVRDVDEYLRPYAFGVFFYIVFYYTLNPLLKIVPQNSFAFTVVISTPIVLFYALRNLKLIISIIIGFLILISAIYSQSRTGTLLTCLGVLLTFSLYYKFIRKLLTFMTVFLAPMCLLLASLFSTEVIQQSLASVVEDYNPRVAALISKPNEVNSQDKSWLIRKLMVKKGLMIFEEHPLLGIGGMRFNDYWVELEVQSERLNKSVYSYNRRSAHNTYIQVLAESGIIALILFISILFFIMLHCFKSFRKPNSQFQTIMFTTILSTSVYFYVISAATGALTWFIISLGVIAMKKDKDA